MGRKRHPGTARTLTQSAYMDAAGRTYGLRVVTNFINPLWLSAVAGRAHHAVVLADGTVRVDGEPLVFTGESCPPGPRYASRFIEMPNACALTTGTVPMRCEKPSHEADRLADEARDAERLAEAIAFNARLRLPVRWVSAIKDVLSGLSPSSWGDGRNRATVNHILLLETLTVDRLTRTAGDFLCTAASGSNGRRYSQPETQITGAAKSAFTSKITCKRCLELARRWTAE